MIAVIEKSFIIAATVLLLVLSILAEVHVVEVVDANPVPFKGAGFELPVTIENPPNGSIQSQSFLAKFHADGEGVFYLSDNNLPGNMRANYRGDFFYTLDGQDIRNSGIKIEDVSQSNYPLITGQVYLSNLAPGNHSITIYWGVRLESGTIMTDPLWGGTSQFFADPQLTLQPTPSIAPTSTVPEFSSWTIPLLLTIAVAAAGLMFYLKKRKLISREYL